MLAAAKFLVLAGKGRQMPLASLLISCSPSRINLENRQEVRQMAPVASSIGAGQFLTWQFTVHGGYAILEYADKKAALEGCAGFLELHRQHWHGWEGEIEMRRHRPRRPTPQLRPKVARVGQSAAADLPPTTRDRNTGNFTDGQNSD